MFIIKIITVLSIYTLSNLFSICELSRAVLQKDFQQVSNLVINGFDVNKKGRTGETPLMWAIKQGHTETSLFLIENDAHINIQDHNGVTPFMLATRAGDNEIIKALLQKDIDTKAKDKAGNTWQAYANDKETVDDIKVLIKKLLAEN